MTQVALASVIAEVTVYREGAQVCRRAEVARAADGFPHEVTIGGLPLCLDDQSVQVRVTVAQGPAPVARDVRVALALPAADPALLPADPAALKAARRREQELAEQLRLVNSQITRLEELPAAPEGTRRKDDPPAAARFETRLALISFRHRELEQLMARRRELVKTQQEAVRERQDLEERDRRASAARAPREHELRKAVVVHLEGGNAVAATAVLHLEYRVPGARWAPAYVARLDRTFTHAQVALRAVVCQRSGEDWQGVSLRLSTADPQGWAELPELHSRRFGRVQAPPPRVGWRPPPEGYRDLFADFEAAFGVTVTSGLEELAAGECEPPVEDVAPDEREKTATGLPPGDTRLGAVAGAAVSAKRMALRPDDGRARLAAMLPPAVPVAAAALPPPPVPMPASAPAAPAAAPLARRGTYKVRAEESPTAIAPLAAGGTGWSAADEEAVAAAALPAPLPPSPTLDAELLDYGRLRMPPPGDPEHGRLRSLRREEVWLELFQQQRITLSVETLTQLVLRVHREAQVAGVPLPPGCRAPQQLQGFSHVFAATAPVDVPADGQFHNLPVVTFAAPVALRLVAAPRADPNAYRVAELTNALAAPLLEGPLDAYLEDDYLLTTTLHDTPAGGRQQLGLGIEQAVRVARNVHYTEETEGLLGGKCALKHRITIAARSHLSGPVALEIRERLPVTTKDEKQLEVKLDEVTPAWERYQPERDPAREGQYRWRSTLKPGEEATFTVAYTVHLPQKLELDGGNRREV